MTTPDEWALVPREPTEAMSAAAPPPPAVEGWHQGVSAALDQIFEQIDCSFEVLKQHGPEITAEGRGYVAASIIESLKVMSDRARQANGGAS
jgi:hypothetical protein